MADIPNPLPPAPLPDETAKLIREAVRSEMTYAQSLSSRSEDHAKQQRDLAQIQQALATAEFNRIDALHQRTMKYISNYLTVLVTSFSLILTILGYFGWKTFIGYIDRNARETFQQRLDERLATSFKAANVEGLVRDYVLKYAKDEIDKEVRTLVSAELKPLVDQEVQRMRSELTVQIRRQVQEEARNAKMSTQPQQGIATTAGSALSPVAAAFKGSVNSLDLHPLPRFVVHTDTNPQHQAGAEGLARAARECGCFSSVEGPVKDLAEKPASQSQALVVRLSATSGQGSGPNAVVYKKLQSVVDRVLGFRGIKYRYERSSQRGDTIEVEVQNEQGFR